MTTFQELHEMSTDPAPLNDLRFIYPGEAFSEDFVCVDREHDGDGRWVEYYTVVLRHPNTATFWAVSVELPSTEMQEGSERDVEIFDAYQVWPKEITKIVYTTEKP